MFFFFNYEGIWQLQGISHIAFVPEAADRTPAAALATSNPTEYSAIVQPPWPFILCRRSVSINTAGTGEANVYGNNDRS